MDSGSSMKYMIPQDLIGKNMTTGLSLSLERAALVNLQSAMVTLRSHGQPVEICWHSINGGPPQARSLPVLIESGRSALMCITLYGQGRGFQAGRNELRLWTRDGNEYLFILTF